MSEEFVHARGLEDRAVEIVAMEMSTDLPSALEGKSSIKAAGYDMTKHAVEKLYKKSGVSPDDLQVVELHDCFSANGQFIPPPSSFLAELVTYEALGLCPEGGAGPFIGMSLPSAPTPRADAGDNTYGGKYVVNPSGGLISKGHPLGATGLAQCYELCSQVARELGLFHLATR